MPTAKTQEAFANDYADIKKRLAEPVPAEKISSKTIQNHRIDFVNVTDYKDLLDDRAGVWEATVQSTQQIGGNLCVVVRIAIHAADGVFAQDGTGLELIEINGYGDPFSNAYAQAFRRACESHGLSRELWRRNERKQSSTGTSKAASTFSKPTRPANGDGMPKATDAQITLLRRKIDEHDLDAATFVQSEFPEVTKMDQLSKAAASFLIDALMH